MYMPFGKHKGTPIEELEDGYLLWVYDLDNLFPPLRKAIDREYEIRFGPASQAPPPPPEPKISGNLTGQEGLLLQEMLRAGFRALALKYHPDQGGTTEGMRQLNALMEKVKKMTWNLNGKH
jgi:hypothetical protein